jgi:hypothetical protein
MAEHRLGVQSYEEHTPTLSDSGSKYFYPSFYYTNSLEKRMLTRLRLLFQSNLDETEFIKYYITACQTLFGKLMMHPTFMEQVFFIS